MIVNVITNPLFPLGRLMATPGVLETIIRGDMLDALNRHAIGDWGDVCPDDKEANDNALKDNTRLFSVYHAGNGAKFWIITEADRSVTTVLLPSDY